VEHIDGESLAAASLQDQRADRAPHYRVRSDVCSVEAAKV
jgi:hypothetical protein